MLWQLHTAQLRQQGCTAVCIQLRHHCSSACEKMAFEHHALHSLLVQLDVLMQADEGECLPHSFVQLTSYSAQKRQAIHVRC